MKSTEQFKKVIQEHLDNLAAKDELFAETYKKEGKNIDDCITYILNRVQESGCNGFADEEIYNMAVHYYDEDKIEVGEPVEASVIINHKVELTQEEIEAAKEKAKQDAIDEIYKQQRAKIEGKKHKEEKSRIDRKPKQPTVQTLF